MASSIPKTYPNLRHLVLSGGGLLGISYIGLLRYLEQANIINNVQTITGCSAGSIFGSLIAIGYKSNEIEKIVKSINFRNYLNVTADSILNFMRTKGLDSGNSLINLIKIHIKDKTGDENITFRQVREKYNIDLRIGVTNLSKNQFELFTSDSQPNLPIHKAIQASCAIPIIFEPIVIDNDVFCDGGLLDNLPIEHINNNDIQFVNIINNSGNDKDKEKDKEKEKTVEDKDGECEVEDVEEIEKVEKVIKPDDEINTLAIYLMNQPESLNKDNLGSITLNNYFNVITRTLSNNLISNKLKKTNNNKNIKVIIFEIPCDIMTFVKISATLEDIDNVIEIAFEKSKSEI
jgi:NTE family protein